MTSRYHLTARTRVTVLVSVLLTIQLLLGWSPLPGERLISTAKAAASSQAKKPNILVIFGDDIGVANVSAYTQGLVGYRTPNIDRIAREGMMFTDYYAEQSCTAGRSAFITGIATLRTGLSKVGQPGATLGLQAKDPTIAELVKPLGYATGQFGKNHLGDRNEYLPTVHGFDEFFGNLYHLNAEEDPESFTYPRDPKFKEMLGPRGVLHTWATDKDDPTEQPRFGRIGKQKIEDTGALTKKRMETIDDETSSAAMDFMGRQVKAGKSFFVWMNSTRMHWRTHVRAEHRDQPGLTARTEYADGMIEHDAMVGSLLKKLDDLGIANDTIVIYTSDNGVHMNSWPDAGMTPFRSEKATNWEGAFRVPAMIRWPGHIKPGQVSNEIFSSLDWSPTLVAAAGIPDITEKLLKGYQAGTKTFKAHQDGYNQLPYLLGEQLRSPRREFFYFNDDGDLVGLRYENWKIVFMEQRAPGTLQVWAEPFTVLRLPKLFDLRADPYERADITSNTYYEWELNSAPVMAGSVILVAKYLESYKEFPPSQRPASFTIDQAMEKLKQGFNQ
jgi:arylsulfatase